MRWSFASPFAPATGSTVSTVAASSAGAASVIGLAAGLGVGVPVGALALLGGAVGTALVVRKIRKRRLTQELKVGVRFVIKK